MQITPNVNSVLLNHVSHFAQTYEVTLTNGELFMVAVQPGDRLRYKLARLLGPGEEIARIVKEPRL